jgi:hypothetical protein
MARPLFEGLQHFLAVGVMIVTLASSAPRGVIEQQIGDLRCEPQFNAFGLGQMPHPMKGEIGQSTRFPQASRLGS